MNIVITMAGIGKRFIDAGYTKPKYMIEVKGKTLFEWSMLSLQQLNSYSPNYIFIVREQDESENFIKNQCDNLGLEKVNIITINYRTDGQATTALLAEEYWNEDEPLFIYNIDTYVEPPNINGEEFKGNGFIPCFIAPGEHWSFVKVDESNKAIEVKEKTRISDNCSIGAYYFKTASLYKELYDEFYKDNNNLVNGEKYIAPLYNLLISTKDDVFISCIDNKSVHVLGTPEEVEKFKCEANTL
ncbi:MAG: glycosyltransferase family 2 protein [Vallitalea sp.]|nr:glycosyltransferase family 2 protein [Vallitalea sp.]